MATIEPIEVTLTCDATELREQLAEMRREIRRITEAADQDITRLVNHIKLMRVHYTGHPWEMANCDKNLIIAALRTCEIKPPLGCTDPTRLADFMENKTLWAVPR